MRLRRGPGSTYRRLMTVRFLLTRDRRAAWGFLRARYPGGVRLADKVGLLRAHVRITNALRGYHTLGEMLLVTDRILRRAGRGPLTVVEAGSGKGASTAKLSLAVRRTGGRLVVFDSFRGIPANDERHVNLYGRPVVFREGAFAARLAEVRRNLDRFGAPEVCDLRKGLFEDTLPGLDDGVDVALLDVDLLESTRTCIRQLWPRLRSGAVLFTQDGHLRAIVELLGDAEFWRGEVGSEPPEVPGLGRSKLLEIAKP